MILPVCLPAHLVRSMKVSTLTENNLGSKFSPLKVQPFSEGRQNKFDSVASPESVSIPLRLFALCESFLSHSYFIQTSVVSVFDDLTRENVLIPLANSAGQNQKRKQ